MILPGDFEEPEEWSAPNFAIIDQHLMREFNYKLWECKELSLPDLELHFAKLGSTVVEPEWFVLGIRRAQTVFEKLQLLKKFMG